MPSVSERKRALTDTSASSGHSWNQSMEVQLTTAGNFLALTLRVEPTGEKHRMTCRRTQAQVLLYQTGLESHVWAAFSWFPTLSCLLTLSMKNFQQLSLESGRPTAFTSFLMAEMMASTSSSWNKPGISPEASRSLMITRKVSSATWESVISSTVPVFFTPAFMYRAATSSWGRRRGGSVYVSH